MTKFNMRTVLMMLVVAFVAAPSLAPLSARAQSTDTPPLPRPRPAHTPTNSAPVPAPLPPDAQVTAPIPGAAGPDSAKSPQEAIARALDGPPQKVTLSAEISEKGSVIPQGLVWRIFGTKPDESGELPLIAKSSKAKPTFKLPPGEYLVHLAYGDAQTTESLSVATAPITKSVILDAGALRLNAQITGQIPIPPEKLLFDIYPGGYDQTGAGAIETKVAPGQTVRLNAGVYHVISHFGKLNAMVKADLRVEPGQVTEATLFHNAAQINFKLVSVEGGEAIADVEWTLKDDQNNTMFTRFGAFPSVVLATGDYTIFAKQGTNVYNRGFSVVPGPSQEIEVLTQVYKK